MIKYLKNQGNFKISDFKGMSYNDIRPIFEKIWDFNQNIEPYGCSRDMNCGKQSLLIKFLGSLLEKNEIVSEKMDKKSDVAELKRFLDIVPREEVPIEVESISTKFPIMDWKTYVLTETFMYYQVFRGDGSSKNYKILSEMLKSLIRLDVEELYRLVKNRYSASRPEVVYYHFVDGEKWVSNSYVDREEISFKPRDDFQDAEEEIRVIMEYLVKDSIRHAFWSLNEDILKITILKTNTSYPSSKIRRIRACTHQRPQRNEAQYAVSRETQYAVSNPFDTP
ncbi:hypothetical protein Tco_0111750, partial [Tanacetum coccineum]